MQAKLEVANVYGLPKSDLFRSEGIHPKNERRLEKRMREAAELGQRMIHAEKDAEFELEDGCEELVEVEEDLEHLYVDHKDDATRRLQNSVYWTETRSGHNKKLSWDDAHAMEKREEYYHGSR